MPGRWGSFVADAEGDHVLHEVGNPAHRCRIEHDDRLLRDPAVGQARTQLAAATRAVDDLRSRGADQPDL